MKSSESHKYIAFNGKEMLLAGLTTVKLNAKLAFICSNHIMTSYCVLITKQKMTKCYLFVIHVLYPGAFRGGEDTTGNLPRSSDLRGEGGKSTIEIKSEYLYVGEGQLKILPWAPKIVWATLTVPYELLHTCLLLCTCLWRLLDVLLSRTTSPLSEWNIV